MRHILTSLVLLVLLFPALASGETLDDLVVRDGLSYKKFTDVPFSGKTTGYVQGTFKNGERDGPWVEYWSNGQLFHKGTYKNGKWDGPYVSYYKNGQLSTKGTYKDGKEDGPWVDYWYNGQLESKGTYKNGVWDGPWVYYDADGTWDGIVTGTYKNGEKVE